MLIPCQDWLNHIQVIYVMGHKTRFISYHMISMRCHVIPPCGISYLSPSLNRWITNPNTNNDLLIHIPSFCVLPVAPVCETRSDPAKSTKFKDDTRARNLVGVEIPFLVGVVGLDF